MIPVKTYELIFSLYESTVQQQLRQYIFRCLKYIKDISVQELYHSPCKGPHIKKPTSFPTLATDNKTEISPVEKKEEYDGRKVGGRGVGRYVKNLQDTDTADSRDKVCHL